MDLNISFQKVKANVEQLIFLLYQCSKSYISNFSILLYFNIQRSKFYQNTLITKKLKNSQMCGRLFQTLPLNRLLQIARTSRIHNQDLHSVSYNVCPTTYIPVIRHSNIYGNVEQQQVSAANTQSLNDKIEKAIAEEGDDVKLQEGNKQPQRKEDRELTFMKWGQKTNFNMIVNGRIEELTAKRTFAKIMDRRCVVIMEGYYQWKSKEEPFCFKPKNSDHFMVAGLYTQQNEVIILTKDATPQLSGVHDRMPVILTHGEVELWLDPKNTKQINIIIQKSLTNKSKAIWKNIGFAKLAPYVNKREQKSNKCLMTVEEYKKELDKKGLMRFWKKKESVEAVGKQGETLTIKSAGNDNQQISEIEKKDPTKSQNQQQDKQKTKTKMD